MEIEREKFLRRINKFSGRKIRDLDECWLWTFGKHSSGYAQYQSGWAKENGCIYAHQSAYKLFKDESYKPSREHPCSHLCESADDTRHRICCNPNHLYIANSIKDNITDRDRIKGNYQAIKTSGCKSGNSIFTPEQIKEIIKLRQDGEYYIEIAERFGCSRRTIEKICLGKTYQQETKETV